RVDVDAADHDAEVEMVAGGEARVAGLADGIATADGRAALDVDRAQMAVEREEPEAVVDHDRVAVDAERPGEHDPAGVPGRDRATAQGGEVEAEVRLLVDRLALVDVRSPVGEAGERRRVREAEE